MTEKKIIRTFKFLKHSIFENVLLLSISRSSRQIPYLDDILLENFIWLNWIIPVKDLIRLKKGFEIFLIDHNASDFENNKIAGKY